MTFCRLLIVIHPSFLNHFNRYYIAIYSIQLLMLHKKLCILWIEREAGMTGEQMKKKYENRGWICKYTEPIPRGEKKLEPGLEKHLLKVMDKW